MILSAQYVKKAFPRKGSASNFITAVQPLTLDIASGELVEITGRSGSGKSTLLSMLAGLLTPTAGQVLLDGVDLYTLDDGALSRLRNEKIGLVPQGNTALKSLTVLENVLLPAVLYSREAPPVDRARELLTLVGLGDLADERPDALSGGELRRMAIARALLLRPGVLLADEPTAGLDAENTRAVLSLLRQAADGGAAVLLVTHEPEAAAYADRVLVMEAGQIVTDKVS